MEFNDIVMNRYATKKFDGKIIDQKKVDELLEIIRYSASSLNLQPWTIKIVTDYKTKEQLLTVTWNQEQITTCSHLLVFCANKNIEYKAEALEKILIENGATKESIKSYIDMIYSTINSMTSEQQLSWSQRQIYLAVGNAINGAKALGFDSCPMEGFNAVEYSKILNLPDNLVPTVVVPIGYAADSQRPKIRFSKKEIFI